MAKLRGTAALPTKGPPKAQGGPGRNAFPFGISGINVGDRLFYNMARVTGLAVIALVILVLFALLNGSWEAMQRFGLGFLSGVTWDPVTEEFGTLPAVMGTILRSVIALLLAVPISIGSAVFIALYAAGWVRTPLSYLVETLAAVPSVIFGLWGSFVLVPVLRPFQVWLKDALGWIPVFGGPAQYGFGILAGGIVLAIMIAPIITAISRDIIRTVPRAQMEGMLALGATKWEAVWKVILPYARVGLFGAVILGLGRAIGETMAVMMLGVGSHKVPTSIFEPVHSMASQIAGEFAEATTSLFISALVYTGLVLFGITIVVNVFAQVLIWRLSKGKTGAVE